MIKILMLVNWKVEKAEKPPKGKQPPDYIVEGEDYWFFRYFRDKVQVDVIDISSYPWLEKLESKKLKFYIWQTIKAIPKLGNYDLVLSHGAQSGVMLCLWRRLFKGRYKHVLFDIGSFNSAAEQGGALKLMQFASKSLDGMIYHTSEQKKYYEKCFPWLLSKSQFIPFGTDSLFFKPEDEEENGEKPEKETILCVGYQKRDWDTLIAAYHKFVNVLQQEREKCPEVEKFPKLLFIGRDSYGALQQIELPLEAEIETTPYVPLEELLKRIRMAEFCVLPLENFNYSFGQMTLLQQMALGKAVITANVPSMADYVKDRENALLYEAGNAEQLCERMLELYKDKELRESLGKQAAKYVKDEHNEEKMAVMIEDFLKKVMQGI